MSGSNPTSSLSSSDPNAGYVCKICGLAFITEQALGAHIDSEYLVSQHVYVF